MGLVVAGASNQTLLFCSAHLALYLVVSLTSAYNVAKGSLWVDGGRGNQTSSEAASEAASATPTC